MIEKKISVRSLVEFVHRQGDIDSREASGMSYDLAAEGSRIHRLVQKKSGEGYSAEVPLSMTLLRDGISYRVEGRADGIIVKDGVYWVDEIKSTLSPLGDIREDHNPLHWYQAMCYGYFCCVDYELPEIYIQLSYCHMETLELKRFSRLCTKNELEDFFTGTLDKLTPWVIFEDEWKKTMLNSARALKFPFSEYRDGQRRLAEGVYRTIDSGGRLYACAPTGIGKTVSGLFPAVKAMGEEKGEKIFYLTAKTITRQVAEETVKMLSDLDYEAKALTVTAKDKICPLEKALCNPVDCPRARGHFDRINEAVFDLLQSQDSLTRDVISSYAEKYRVCPYEMSLDAALWSDIIICDYNYLFDPEVYFRRFFMDGGDYIFLIDEAHNLVDRAREMYSAQISKADILAAKKLIPKGEKKLKSALNKVNRFFLEMRELLEDQQHIISPERIADLEIPLMELRDTLGDWLGQNAGADDLIVELYFDVLSFIRTAGGYDENYVSILEKSGGMRLKYYCVNPSVNLDKAMDKGRAAVLFSATLLPVDYYASLLGGNEKSRTLVLDSPFPPENLCLLCADRISTRYRDREHSIETVAEMIFTTASHKKGGYIAYFPSYKYMTDVYESFVQAYPEAETVIQESGMDEYKREEFLKRFDGTGNALIGFCVMGGIFAEGIDLQGDRLIGSVIVGVGLPQINMELDIIRDHFNAEGSSGYDYAYRYPGMNKVMQAAGRVIRGASDKGVVLLIDDRFMSASYTGLFPAHWRNILRVRDTSQLKKCLDDFWAG